MRTNALKAKLREGRRVVGVLVTIQNAELVELFGHLGYDFVFLDAQHGGLTVETARELIRAAELTGMTALVRVPRNDPSVILEYLDVGAPGIIVPNITNKAAAEAAVSAIKYPPRGAVRKALPQLRLRGVGAHVALLAPLDKPFDRS